MRVWRMGASFADLTMELESMQFGPLVACRCCFPTFSGFIARWASFAYRIC